MKRKKTQDDILSAMYSAMVTVAGKDISEANDWFDKEMEFRKVTEYAYPEVREGEFQGREIAKVSGKPFPSGKLTATVCGMAVHPYKEGGYGFVLEDGNIVEIIMCKFV